MITFKRARVTGDFLIPIEARTQDNEILREHNSYTSDKCKCLRNSEFKDHTFDYSAIPAFVSTSQPNMELTCEGKKNDCCDHQFKTLTLSGIYPLSCRIAISSIFPISVCAFFLLHFLYFWFVVI